MTCKDCIHYEACKTSASYFGCGIDAFERYELRQEVEKDCADFKPKSRYIELPCAVGDTVYQIVYCRCGNPQCYEQGHCWKTITKATPKSYGHIMKLQMGKRLVPDPFYGLKTAYVPKGTICHKIYQKPFDLKMIADFGKTVFLTKEEALKALAERGKND